MPGDIEKVDEFRERLKNGDPNALLSLEGLKKESKGKMIDVADRFIRDYSLLSYPRVEATLVERYINPTKFISKKFERVTGPVSVTEMSSAEYKQIFYLFGDHHQLISKCDPKYPLFYDWIRQTIENSPVFIDLYLETPYKYKNYPSASMKELTKDNYIYQTYLNFEDCFEKGYSEKCLSSRHHYTDVRRLFEVKESKRGMESISIMSRYPVLIHGRNIELANSYIKYLSDENSIVSRRIRKQFSSIGDKKIREKLTDLFEECKAKYIDKIEITGDLIKDEKKMEKMKSISDVIFYYEHCFMDYYLMARCFRRFERRKDEYHLSPANIIIFAGDIHINNYVEILKKLGFTINFRNERTNIDDPNYQCLDISKMEQPMFHQRYK